MPRAAHEPSRSRPAARPGSRRARHAMLVAVLAAATPVGCGAPENALPGTPVDLTHPFDASTVYWPTSPTFELEVLHEGVTDAGFYYAAKRFAAAEHGGTHLDAPVHFFGDGRTVGEIPLEQLVGPAVVVDVREACARDRDYRVTRGDLEAWEDEHGRIPTGALVLLHTGFARHWPDRERYLGTAERGAEAARNLHFPGLHAEAARWLVEERHAGAVGIDTASIDHGPSADFAAHQVLAAAQVPVFENLTNLDRLPPRGALVVALPMRIEEGTGAPLRAVAFVP